MDIKTAVNTVIAGKNLSAGEMHDVMQAIMGGDATPAQIGGFLVGLRVKGESIEEIAAAARVMRELAAGVDVRLPYLVDTCGTGGDASGTFNISTASAFVAAAAGANVAKHGNRSVSSSSGSADVLEAAGVKLDLTPKQVAECIRQCGLGFMFAPLHHGAMRHAIGPRRELGVRTVFNVLGPLTNPASAPNQVIGVFDAHLTEPLARVLGQLGSHHVMVVHSDDGLDEIGLSGTTRVSELRRNQVDTYQIGAIDFGIDAAPLETIQVTSPAESLELMHRAFENEATPARDIIALNAGAAIYVSGREQSLADGVSRASALIASGAAREKLQQFIAVSNTVKDE